MTRRADSASFSTASLTELQHRVTAITRYWPSTDQMIGAPS